MNLRTPISRRRQSRRPRLCDERLLLSLRVRPEGSQRDLQLRLLQTARLCACDASTPECCGTWFESDQLRGISQRGNLQLRPNAWWSWSDTHPDRRAFVFRDYPGGWSDSNEQRNAVLVRSAPPQCHDQFGSLRRRSIDTAIFAPGYL